MRYVIGAPPPSARPRRRYVAHTTGTRAPYARPLSTVLGWRLLEEERVLPCAPRGGSMWRRAEYQARLVRRDEHIDLELDHAARVIRARGARHADLVADDLRALFKAVHVWWDEGFVMAAERDRSGHDDQASSLRSKTARVEHTVVFGRRVREVWITTEWDGEVADEALELAALGDDDAPLWNYLASMAKRRDYTPLTVSYETLASGEAVAHVCGSSIPGSGHEEYDEYDDFVRLSDGKRVRADGSIV